MRSAFVLSCALLAISAQADEPLRWVRSGRPTTQAQELIKAFGAAERYGLSPDAY